MKITCSECLESLSKDHVLDAVKAMQFVDGILSRGEIQEVTLRRFQWKAEKGLSASDESKQRPDLRGRNGGQLERSTPAQS